MKNLIIHLIWNITIFILALVYTYFTPEYGGIIMMIFLLCSIINYYGLEILEALEAKGNHEKSN